MKKNNLSIRTKNTINSVFSFRFLKHRVSQCLVNFINYGFLSLNYLHLLCTISDRN